MVLRRRNLRSIGSPPWATLRRIVARRSSRRPRAARALAPREPRAHRAREPLGERGGLGALLARRSSVRDVLGRQRLVRGRAALAAAAFGRAAFARAARRPIWAGSVARSSAPGPCSNRRGERAASACGGDPDARSSRRVRARTRRTVRRTARDRSGASRTAPSTPRAGARAGRRAASPAAAPRPATSAWPIAKPGAAQRVRRSRRGAGASPDPGRSPRRRMMRAARSSRHLAEQALVVSGLIARAILVGLQQRDQRVVDDLRLLPHDPRRRGRRASPPSRAFLRRREPCAGPPCAASRPCARSAARGSRRCRAGGRGGSPLRDRRRENRDSDRGSGGAARRRVRACRSRSGRRAGSCAP